jgi:SAM-dependent methyltransferase
MRWQTVKVGTRFAANRVSLAARQDGYGAAAAVAVRTAATELRKLPRLPRVLLASRSEASTRHPTGYSEAILESLRGLSAEVRPFVIDPSKFQSHVRSFAYPRAYAAGPLSEGGFRENKLLEYFLALEILGIRSGQVIVDVASEYSIFPTVARQLHGATVFRQDLIYPRGIHGDRIGGSAASMPISDEFADALVLHNSFEHFEGTADSDFVAESWRVLRPGGTVVIVPLFVSDHYCILSDPLTDRRGITWDAGAEVTQLPGWHNRFGRFYSAAALERRVLSPAMKLGYRPQILHFVNVKDVHPLASTYFSLLLRKPRDQRPADPSTRTAC